MYPTLIVDSPTKVTYIKQHFGEAVECICTHGLLYDLPKGVVGVDIFSGFSLSNTLLSHKEKIIREILSVKLKPFYVLTSPSEDGERLYAQVLQLLNLPDSSKFHLCPLYLTPDIVKNAQFHGQSLNRNLLDAAEARRAIERLSGVLLSEFLSVVVPLFGYDKKNLLTTKYISLSAASILLNIHTQTILLHSQGLGSQMILKNKTGFSAGEVIPNPATPIENLVPKYYNSTLEAEDTFQRVQEYSSELKQIDTKVIVEAWSPPSSLTTEALHTHLYSLFSFKELELLSILNNLYDKGLITFYYRSPRVLNPSILENVRKYYEDNNLLTYLDTRKLGKLTQKGLNHCVLPVTYDSSSLEHDQRLKEVFEAIINYTLLFFCRPLSQKVTYYLFSLRKHRFLGSTKGTPYLVEEIIPPFDFTYLNLGTPPKDEGESYAIWLYALEALNEGMTIQEILEPFINSPCCIHLMIALDQLLLKYNYLEIEDGKCYLTEKGFTCSELLLSFYSKTLSLENYKLLQRSIDLIKFGRLGKESFMHDWFTTFRTWHEDVMTEIELDLPDKDQYYTQLIKGADDPVSS